MEWGRSRIRGMMKAASPRLHRWGAGAKRQGNRTQGDPRVSTLLPYHPRPYGTNPLPCSFHKISTLERPRHPPARTCLPEQPGESPFLNRNAGNIMDEDHQLPCLRAAHALLRRLGMDRASGIPAPGQQAVGRTTLETTLQPSIAQSRGERLSVK